MQRWPQAVPATCTSNTDDNRPWGQHTVNTSHVDTLFTELAGMYGARFTSAWGQYDKSGVWERELAMYTPEMLTNGLRRCRQQARDAAHAGETAWPPQPIEFAALCDPRPEDMGLPGADAAWREAIRHCHAPHAHHWSHDAVRIAGRHVGWEDIHHSRVMNGESAERRFYAQYKTLTRKAMRGEALTPQHLLEADHMKRPAVAAELAGRERAGQRAQRFRNAGTGNQALSAMRSMLCTA